MATKPKGNRHLRPRVGGKNIKAELAKSKIDPYAEGYDDALEGAGVEQNPYVDKRPPPWDLSPTGEGPSWADAWREGHAAGVAESVERDRVDAWKRRRKGATDVARR